MTAGPDAEYKESMYPYTHNTRNAAHEFTVNWVEAVVDGGGGFDMARRSPAPPSQRIAGAVNLVERSEQLAEEYDLPVPKSIRWARLRRAWGNCNRRTIQIDHGASTLPPWVLDGIIIHELAHLAVKDHGDAFTELVARYPLAREVHGYLTAIQDREWGVHVAPAAPNRRRSPL